MLYNCLLFRSSIQSLKILGILSIQHTEVLWPRQTIWPPQILLLLQSHKPCDNSYWPATCAIIEETSAITWAFLLALNRGQDSPFSHRNLCQKTRGKTKAHPSSSLQLDSLRSATFLCSFLLMHCTLDGFIVGITPP